MNAGNLRERAQAIVASTFPDLGDVLMDRLPPAEWFASPPAGWDPVRDPQAPLVHVTFSGPERGRFAALVAPFDACLLNGRETNGCFPTPRSVDGYGFAHVGTSVLAGGQTLKTANIGGGINHADHRLRSHDQVLDRYANTASKIAAVRYVESEELGGIVGYGALVPGVTVAQALDAMQSALSGDWRFVNELGGYRFIGSQLVNVPGYRPWQLGQPEADRRVPIRAGAVRPVVVQSAEVVTAAACGCLDKLPAQLNIEWVARRTLRDRAREFVLARAEVAPGEAPAVTASSGALRAYWVSGKGAAKIQWGSTGSFRRCVSELSRYVSSPEGLCAKYHKAATGKWPGARRAVTASGNDRDTVTDMSETNTSETTLVDDDDAAFLETIVAAVRASLERDGFVATVEIVAETEPAAEETAAVTAAADAAPDVAALEKKIADLEARVAQLEEVIAESLSEDAEDVKPMPKTVTAASEDEDGGEDEDEDEDTDDKDDED